MAKYKAYPEYKDSGAEWLGEVPAHWKTLAIKHVAKLNPSKLCISLEKMKGMCSFIPMEKLKFNSLSLDEIKYIPDVYNGYTYFENEDNLIAKVTPCFENKNMVVAHYLHNGIGFGSSEIYVLRCNDIIKNDFLFYRLQEDNFMSIAEGAMTGAGGLKRVPSEVLNNFKFGLPSKKEQSIIVDFLKHETTKIDNLIEMQQQLIELLKEKRQAVISHAVTKGLNPDVPMKDSGVEWLGEVPAHWVIPKLLHVTKAIGDGLHSTPEYDVATGYYFINGNNLVDGKISIGSTAKEVSRDEYNKHYVYLDEKTVLLSINGTIGNVAIYNNEKVILGKSAAYVNCGSELDVNYLMYYFMTNESRYYFDLEVTGTTIFNLSLNSIRQMKVCIPPLEEQQLIVECCVEKQRQYNYLIDSAEMAIKVMQERRTALISAAVTGKIDVRDWVAPATQDAEVSQEATA